MEKKALTRIGVLGTVALIILMISFSFIGSPISADVREDRGISMKIEREKGQDVLFVNDTESYKIDIVGRFQADGEVFRAENADNWSLKTETDMDATIKPEDQESNQTNEFEVDVTIHEEGSGHLTFTAYCTKGESTRYSEREVEVKVVESESISVNVENPSSYKLEDVEVMLYIDGQLMNSKTIESLASEESTNVQFNWSSHNLDSGEHTLEIKTDYGFEGEEETLLSRTFHVEKETNTALYAGIAAVSIGASLLVFFWYRRRKKRRRRPW